MVYCLAILIMGKLLNEITNWSRSRNEKVMYYWLIELLVDFTVFLSLFRCAEIMAQRVPMTVGSSAASGDENSRIRYLKSVNVSVAFP